MEPELLKVLLQADDPTACEYPADFDWDLEMAQVRALTPILEGVVGRTWILDEHVEDASFFTDLGIYREETTPQGGVLVHTLIAVRFSAFGRLFTVLSASEENERLDPAIVQRIVRSVEEQGYAYVDAAELDEPYSGRNPHLKGVSWWIRFFDYF